MNATVFFDIDGCLLKHHGTLTAIYLKEPQALPHVNETLEYLAFNGHQIILTTARPECLRKFTEKQLEDCGIFYNQLVMGVEHGKRIIVNDSKPDMEVTAHAFTIPRDGGLDNLQIQLEGLLGEKQVP